MPRDISGPMLAHLAKRVVTLTTLIKIERTDGVTLCFTSWDVPVLYSDSNTYLPAISMSPSGVKGNSDLTTDQMDIIAAIDSVYITEADIDAGRYDMAYWTVFRVNPFDITMGPIIDLVGYTGSVDYAEGQLTVAINSLGQRLNQTFGDVISPMCRVKQLGDGQCKVIIGDFTFSGMVSTVSGKRIITFSDTNITGYYDYVMIIFNSLGAGGGSNHNLMMEVKSSVSNGVCIATLYGSPTAGTFTLTASTGGVPQTTAPIPYNAVGSTVQAALEALTNVGVGNVTVTGSARGPYTITPIGLLAGLFVIFVGDGTLLTGGTTIGIASECLVTTSGGTVMQITLVQPMPFGVSIADTFTIQAGCNRQSTQCRGKFNNLVNFHGEPYVPGNDYLLTTGYSVNPGAN